MTSGNMCPACGYDDLIDPPYTDEGGSSYEICPSCGFEYGFTDDNDGYTFETWRQKWIAAGHTWYSRSPMRPAPPDWDPLKQLANLRP